MTDLHAKTAGLLALREGTTPGPWALSDETTRDGLPSRLIHAMPQGMLAIIRTGNQGGHYGSANARLIAAAPALLDAIAALQAEVVELTARAEAAEALVERAFKDGLRYARTTNLPTERHIEEAWAWSQVRADLAKIGGGNG